MATALDDRTARYVNWATRVTPLTKDEELSLARAYLEDGDRKAADRVLTANLRHVIPVALRYRHYGVPVGELIAQGNAALPQALDRFDPSRGLRFSTYANYWVRADILSHILEMRTMVGGGRGHLRPRYFFRLRKEYQRAMQELGDHERALEVLSERLGHRPERIRDTLGRIAQRDASLDAQLDPETSTTLADTIVADPGEHDESLAGAALRDELQVAVQEATGDCSDRERYILEHRLMAEDDERMSLVDIGRQFGVSRERVRQLEARLKQRLKGRLRPLASRWEIEGATA